MQQTSAPVSKSQGEMCPCAFIFTNGLLLPPLIVAMLMDKIEKIAPIHPVFGFFDTFFLVFSNILTLLWADAKPSSSLKIDHRKFLPPHSELLEIAKWRPPPLSAPLRAHSVRMGCRRIVVAVVAAAAAVVDHPR